MITFSRNHKAFTLAEVLVALIVIGLVSTSAWLGVSVLVRSSETGRNRSMAVNLLQKSQEEVRRAASLSFFDTLHTCQFPDGTGGSNPCGYADTSLAFPDFQRVVNITDEGGSPELKRAVILVTWLEWGQNRQLQSVVLLARPPALLPGNIYGLVHAEANTTPLSGVTISVRQASGAARNTNSTDQVIKGGNFSFAEYPSGRFLLPAGNWNLTASAPGYFPYTHSQLITVDSNQDVFVDLPLKPKPTPATIRARVKDSSTGNYPGWFGNAVIRLYKDGAYYTESWHYPSANFTIPFSDSNPQCFTLLTYLAYRAGYAGASPSCNPQIPYHSDGWSSSRMLEGGGLACAHPWQGGPAVAGDDPDRICVNPGEDKPVDVPLVPVPRATITGRIVDYSTGSGIPGAKVYARWPRAAGSLDWGSTYSASDGSFTMSVPAVQDLFSDGFQVTYYLQVWAESTGPVLDCCNELSQETRNSATIFVGPLRSGDNKDAGDLVIIRDSRQRDCGNAQGQIKDDFSKAPLDGVKVVLSAPATTDFSGNYQLICDPAQAAFFKLRTGNYALSAEKSGYYNYFSRGDLWRYKPVPDAVINRNGTTTYNAVLWPKGYGKIVGTVRDRGTGKPLAKAVVQITLYDGSQMVQTTDALGQYVHNSVPETWPPAALPLGSNYYKYDARGISFSVTHPSGVYTTFTDGIPKLDNGQTLTKDAELVTQGNM